MLIITNMSHRPIEPKIKKGTSSVKYLPEMYRTFCHGELSLCLERFGGIDAISLLDIERKNGLILPDQNCTPIFSRNASTSMGRALYSSAIRFLGKRKKDGKVYYFYPGNPETSPWSVSGGDMDGKFELMIDDSTIFVRCESHVMKTLNLWISAVHLFEGAFDSYKNQRLSDVEQKHLERVREAFNPNVPLPNGKAVNRWNREPDFDGTYLIFHGITEFPYGTREIHVAIAIGTKGRAVLEKFGPQFQLSCEFPVSGKIDSSIAVAYTAIEAKEKAKKALLSFDFIKKVLAEELKTTIRNAPELRIRNFPSAGRFLKELSGWCTALLVGDGIGVRASSHNYGYFPLWDAIWPIRDFLWNNRLDEAEKMLRYLIAYPHMEAQPWSAHQLIAQFNEYLFYREDPALVRFAMPYFQKFLDISLRLCNQESGLLASLANSANDHPEETGLTGFYCASCVNGFWYDALRVLENLAVETGYPEIAEKAREIARKLEKNYVATFFLENPGYLRLAVRDDLTAYPDEIFQNSSTIGLDYLYGRCLMRNILKPLAHYQAAKLFHPMGHTAVAQESPVKCEMWKSVHMNQHNGHEMKLARLAGNVPEAYRVMSAFFGEYERYGVAVETFNLCGCKGNEQQNATWQAFAATSASEAIRAGLIGIELHRGGWFYTPADDDHEAEVKNVHVRGITYDIEISGKGLFAEMSVDGIPVSGSLQIPADFPLTGKRTWKITRTTKTSDRPVLLCAFDLPVMELVSSGEDLAFTSGASGRFPIHVFSKRKPSVFLNGTRMEPEYSEEDNSVWIDPVLKRGDRIVFACGK